LSAAAIVEESTIFSAGWAIARLPYAWEGHGAQSAGADRFRTCFVLIAQGLRRCFPVRRRIAPFPVRMPRSFRSGRDYGIDKVVCDDYVTPDVEITNDFHLKLMSDDFHSSP
jgi:hypothetical protein